MDSISGQTHKNVEVVLQDGGSTDGTLTIAASYQESIPTMVILQEKDQGIYDAMNKALKKASGEWVIFMGSDDQLESDQVLHQIAKVMWSSKADVIYGNVRIIGDTGWAKDGDIYAGAFDLPKLLDQNICHQAMFYRREFLNQEIGDFNTRYAKSSDWDLNLRCWSKGNFQFVDLLVSEFAAGGLSSTSTDHELIADYIDNILRYFQIGLFHPLINRPTFIFYKQL